MGKTTVSKPLKVLLGDSFEVHDFDEVKPIQKFIDDNVYYSDVMREEAQEYGIDIVDTTDLSPEQVAQAVADKINP